MLDLTAVIDTVQGIQYSASERAPCGPFGKIGRREDYLAVGDVKEKCLAIGLRSKIQLTTACYALCYKQSKGAEVGVNRFLIAVSIYFLAFTPTASSQPANLYGFSGDVDLGLDYTVFISSGLHYIGAKGDTVYVVTSNGWTWCSKSTDGGQTFGSPVRVNSTAAGYNPSMRVDTAGVIFVAYQNEYADIYFSKSSDGGATFTPGVKVNDDTIPENGQEKPSIAVNNRGQIFIAWADQRNSAPHTHQTVFGSASYDGGVDFTPNVQGNEAGTIMSGGIDVGIDDSSRVYIAYRGTTNGLFGIVVARSTDSGQSFGNHALASDLPLDSNFQFAENPSIAISPQGMVGVAWADFRFNQWTLRFSVSRDCGQTFSASVNIDDTPGSPSLIWRNDLFYAVWPATKIRPSDSLVVDDIFFSYSADTGSTFVPYQDVNASSAVRSDRGLASLAVNGEGKAFVAWADNRLDPYYSEDWHTFVAWGAHNGRKGDLNLDGLLTAVDVVLLLNAVFLGSPYPASFQTADVNCDGRFSPSDAVILLNAVFLGSAVPCS